MANNIESYVPVVQYNGLNSAKDVSFTGAFNASGSVTIANSGTAVVLIGGSNSATVAGGSATVNAQRGVITTGSLTTGSLTIASFDVKNTSIGASSQIFASVYNGTNTQGVPVVSNIQVGTAGSATINFANVGQSPLNGTLKFNFIVLS